MRSLVSAAVDANEELRVVVAREREQEGPVRAEARRGRPGAAHHDHHACTTLHSHHLYHSSSRGGDAAGRKRAAATGTPATVTSHSAARLASNCAGTERQRRVGMAARTHTTTSSNDPTTQHLQNPNYYVHYIKLNTEPRRPFQN